MTGLGQTPERQSQVTHQTNDLAKSLLLLHDKIETFTDRLSSVLRTSAPTQKTEDKEHQELVPLASTIENSGAFVKSAIFKLEDILGRLEL